jgi:P-type Ca2+ transporter type 2C
MARNGEKMADWHSRQIADVLGELKSDAARGLEQVEAAGRLAQIGPNELVERGAKSPLRILWEQFTATMVLILIAAGLVSGFLGKLNEMASILAIVVLFGLLGFVQEYRAEKAMAALKKMAVPQVRARRDGSVRELPARELVPGDIVLLEAGNVVPADGRLIEGATVRAQEAALTGESEAVEKETRAFPAGELPLGDRRNMVYMGTQVTYGRGVMVVTETGMAAELGRIASALQEVKHEHTPLQRRLDQVGKLLAGAGVLVALLVMALGLLRGEALGDMFLAGVSVAVAVVPEGLPAVVTLTLALGARRMLRRNALIRKLPAVETLGSVTVICSDKTGTLTENRMTVVALDAAGHRLDLSEIMRHYMPAMDRVTGGQPALPPQPGSLMLLAAGGALCNDATLRADGGHLHAIGDPTEGALLVAAAQLGLMKDDLDRRLPRVAELPFDSDRKRMTTLHHGIVDFGLPIADSGSPVDVAFTKGAVDGLLTITTNVWVNDHVEPMTEEWRGRIESANTQLAGNGVRVLGVAFRLLSQGRSTQHSVLGTEVLETDLTFIGLIGLIDPPREAVKAAVATCRAAGVRPVMITGDHPLTALSIAQQLGIAANGRALTGQEVAAMPDDELRRMVEGTSVFARVSPEHKLRIVEALQTNGHVVAMTGDGVNDAPALKRADIGVAMGITGTDVSKEASDMVLLDDNFATIVSAVEEGRTIYNNVRRFVKFSIAGNIGKIAVMLAAPLLGMPLPLLPLQLLWLNLLTDGLLGLGMGLEPAERNTMRRPPRSPNEGMFAGGVAQHVAWLGVLLAALALGVGFVYWSQGHASWQTMIFTALAFGQIGQALAVRSTRDSLFSIGLLSNKPLLGMVVAVFVLQLVALYMPGLETFFGITPLSAPDLAICVALGVAVFAAVEVEKWLTRRSIKSLQVATGEVS